MRILVTGGAGFIGSNYVRRIIDGTFPGYSAVTVLDKLSYAGNLENLANIDIDSYKFIKGDICDSVLVGKLVKENDVIVNFAAESHVDRSIQDASNFITTNIQGVQNLLDAIKKFENRRFLQISTDEVYGSVKFDSADENYGLFPNSPYAASKASADLLVRSYFKTFGMDVVTTRSSNNYGQNQYPEKLIPLFITNLLEGKKIPVYGSGENIRDWIHVDDNCLAIHNVLVHGKSGEIYNIGGGNEISNLELTYLILNAIGASSDSITYVADRLGHDYRYSVDSTKIRGELGFEPRIQFLNGLVETIQWYKNNEVWWRKLQS
jgi:dTDP-glucose 4,6-dehydratase